MVLIQRFGALLCLQANTFNEMRSKTKRLDKPLGMDPKAYPDWSYDGSSTGQAEGNNSDCILRPVRIVKDPIRGGDHVLVLCDVLAPNGKPHPSNTRQPLVDIIDDAVTAADCWYGFEQEYTMINAKTGRVWGWPADGYPAPQGPFYCGVGPASVFGRELAEAHLEACMQAGLKISGINAEVLPGQWEYQVRQRRTGGPFPHASLFSVLVYTLHMPFPCVPCCL